MELRLFSYIFTVIALTLDLSFAQNSPALVPSCNPNPCRNNGRCMTSNGQNYCKCDVGFVGSTCQYRNPCNPSQCQNGGTCKVTINDVQPPQFSCTCPLGYTASLCEIPIPNACDKSPCMYHGTCQLITLNESKCICPNGYLGEHCEIIDYCAPEPCKNGATCISTKTPGGSGYQCQCASGFQGPICTEDIDECAAPKSPCVRGKCVNLPGSYRCECSQGYTGKNCDQVYVPCDPSPCQNGGQCIVFGQFKYFCQCPAGFTGKNCEQNIDDCAVHLCQNGGKCVDGLNNYTCKCPPTYRGQYCTEDVDECAENKYMCQNSGTCQNTVGGFSCICVNGWEGKYCQINHDDCEHQQCFNGGTCIDRVGTFSCNCSIGWTGLLCHLRDACMSSPCQGRGKCDTNPVDGGYLCSCAPGFKGGDCSLDIDECANDNPCEHQGTCVNTPGSYRCECAAGWTGEFCDQNVNECASHPCQNDATCLDDVGRFICVCKPGFTGTFCEVNLNDRACSSSPCMNGGKCRSQAGAFRCECLPGFSGDRCQNNINECASQPCENNATCIDQIGKFTCVCPPGFTGVYCETNIGDRACASSPCQNGGRCRSTLNGFTCECLPGFSGERCQVDLDECASNPCRNGATCKDGPHSYSCKCPLGFSGRDCEINDNDCTANSCLNGGKCMDGINNFTCQCLQGYRGRNCELRDSLDGLYKEVDIRETEMCRLNSCEKKADDGICHPECNYYACGFDGDDCSAGLKPFKRCQSPCYCWHRFQDGTCDPECNNEECLFDGYDCVTGKNDICNPLYVAYCTSHFRDGHCDSGCNTSGCNYDGGDCEPKVQTQQPLQGSIVMIVTVDPEVFINNSNRFLMVVGKLVDATVQIQRDDAGRLMIYRWNSRDGMDKTSPVTATSLLGMSGTRIKRQVFGTTPAPYLTGTLVVLTVDISRCVAAGRTDCFKEIISVADFLGAASAKEALKQTLGWDVYSISANEPSSTSSNNQSTTMIVVGVIVAIAVTLLGVYVIVRQKRKIQAPLWVPDGYQGKMPAAKIAKKNNDSSDLDNFERSAVPNQYETDRGFIRSSCASTTRSRNDFCQSSVNGFDSRLGDYLNWNEGRADSYSQCSDNETYSTYADSQSTATVAPTPVPHNAPQSKRFKVYLPASGLDELASGWQKEHKDVVSALPDAKYVPPPKESINAKGPDNVTPLMVAVTHARNDKDQEEMICRSLINSGANIDDQTETYGDTALLLAVKNCRPGAVRMMVQSGADTNLADIKGCTPLHHAIAVYSKEIVMILLESRSTNVDKENDDLFTPLIFSAMLSPVDNTEIMEVLLNHGAKVTCKDKNGRTALHWASLHDHAAAISLLIRKGADKDAQDEQDQTPLFLAAREGNFDAVKRLLELGANKDITDQMDRLPRDIAIEKNHKEIVQLLDTPPALLTAAQLSQKATYECTGTLPHMEGRGPKPKPPKRTKSLRDTANAGKASGEGTRKKTPQKKQQMDEISAAIGATMPQQTMLMTTHVGKPPPQIVPSITVPQKQNPHPSILMSPCYLDHATPLQTPNLSYHQPQMPSQRQVPAACTFSPPQSGGAGGASGNGSYACSSYSGQASGGGNMYYHRSPEAATCYIQSPPPYPQKCTDTALYNFASSNCGQSQQSAQQPQRHLTAATPGYTQWPPQNTGDYVDYCSANGNYEYDTTTYQQPAQPMSVETAPMQEADVDAYYQQYHQMQQQQMWAQRDVYRT